MRCEWNWGGGGRRSGTATTTQRPKSTTVNPVLVHPAAAPCTHPGVQVDVCHHATQHRQAAGATTARSRALLLPQLAPLPHTVPHCALLLPEGPLAARLLAPLPLCQLLRGIATTWVDTGADTEQDEVRRGSCMLLS